MTQEHRDIKNAFDELDKLLTERISELHEVKGGMQGRHAYLYYRSLLWETRNMVYEVLNNLENTKSDE